MSCQGGGTIPDDIWERCSIEQRLVFEIDLFKDRRNKEEDKETRSGCQIEEREEEEMK